MSPSKYPTKSRILHADDEEIFRLQIKSLLESDECIVDSVNDGVEVMNAVQQNDYDLLLLDLNMPKVSGLEVLRFVKEKYPRTEIIMITGNDNIKIAVDCMREGAFHYITKPFLPEELLQVIDRAIEHRYLLQDNSILKSQVSRLSGHNAMVGESESFKHLLSIAERVAASDTSVLIQGPSGTGKELIANFIHQRSLRAERPLVTINCAAIPDTLLESELFGHEKGAFTDARAQKQGLIELANKGTLFLDEVGDISPIVQPKILRFVQTGEFRRIGGTANLRADVRIIAATNKDLTTEVQTGRFREDLLYRLNVITITMPSLYERKSDIPLLVANFLQNNKRIRVKKQLTPDAMQLLINYQWPGNVRELENVLESASILSRGEMIEPDDIILPRAAGRSMNRIIEPVAVEQAISLKNLEQIHITNILKTVKGDKKQAAKILGISLKTLYTKIAQYNLT
jgi:DNA-binding NtrC family response regulator